MSEVVPGSVGTEQSQPTPEPLNPVQALIERLTREAEEPAPAQSQEGTVEATESAKDAIEAATGEPAPEQKDNESDQAYEIRLAKIQKELKAVWRENEGLKKDASQVPELRKKVAALESDLKKRVPMGKKAVLQFIKDVASDKVKLDDDELEQLPEAVRTKLAKIDEWEAEKQQAEYQAIRTKELGIVAKFLEDNADDYPLYEGGSSWAAEAIYEAFYDYKDRHGVLPSLHKIASAMHDRDKDLLIPRLKGKKAKDFLLRADPELKALLGAAEERKSAGPASVTKGNPGNEDGPRSLTNSMAQVTSPHSGKRQTEDEIRAEILSEFNAWKRAQGD